MSIINPFRWVKFCKYYAKEENFINELTLKGSACSQEIGAPQETGLILSGNDSGTANSIKSKSNKAIAVAKAITNVS